MYALVDCNSFYASCERLFRPDLRESPIAVLSNNDGCVIALCEKAKALGLKMGQPYHQVRAMGTARGIVFFSSNYSLYGDLSRRVMALLSRAVPALEVYSIDEAFLDLRGMSEDWLKWSKSLKNKIMQYLGLPVCVGVARTKTLAKAANRVAKKFKQRTDGVWVLDSPALEEKCLRWLGVEEIWGIGFRQAAKLKARGIHSAWDFAHAPSAWVQSNLSIVGVRLQKELLGQSCLPLETLRSARQSICSSRSFGSLQGELGSVEAALADHALRCAQKLRAEGLCASRLVVFLHTNPHREDLPQRSLHGLSLLEVPSQDSVELTGQALRVLREIWQDGYAYQKTGVIVEHLLPQSQVQGSLFDSVDRDRAQKHMRAWDALSAKYGRGVLGLGIQEQKGTWELRRALLSPAYTTREGQMPEFSC